MENVLFKKNNKQHQGQASTCLSQSKDQNDSVMVPLIISSPAETVVQIEPDRSCPIYCNNSL